MIKWTRLYIQSKEQQVDQDFVGSFIFNPRSEICVLGNTRTHSSQQCMWRRTSIFAIWRVSVYFLLHALHF